MHCGTTPPPDATAIASRCVARSRTDSCVGNVTLSALTRFPVLALLRRPPLGVGNCMQFDQKRRDFIALICGVAAWPLAARAQQGERRVGVLVALAENHPEVPKWIAAFRRGLDKLGWSEGRNVQFDYRFAPAGAQAPALAKELLALHPDAILAFSTPVAAAFQRETRTIPIVFIGVADAVAQ